MASLMQQVFQAFKNAGLSDNQAKIITAEVGRETSFLPQNLFGSHTDDKNKKTNVGMLSWQNGREIPLLRSLEKNGVLKDGKITQGQQALNIMANYALHEIRTKPEYSQTKKTFLDNPDVDYKTASGVLGRNFIRWRHDDPEYSSGHKNRDQFYQQLGGDMPNAARDRYEMSKDEIVKRYRQQQKEREAKQAQSQPSMTKDEIVSLYNKRKAEGTLPTSSLTNVGGKQPIDSLPVFDENGVFVPQTEPDPVSQKTDTTLLDKAKGVGEAALTLGTGATTGALGYAGGALHGIGQSIVDGTFGTQQGAQNAAQLAERGANAGTYIPRTETGQNIVGAVGETLGTLPPVMGGIGMQAATLGKASIPQVAAAAQRAQPVIQQAAQTAAKPVQATVNAARSGVENLRNAVGMGRVADDGATPANVGAAQVDQATIRQALAQDLPVTPELTQGQLSRDPAQLKFEVETAKDGDLGAPLRQRYEQQHEAVQQSIDAFIDQTGAQKYSSYDVGAMTDKALQKQMTADKNRVRVAYAKADKSEEANTPIDLVQPVDVIENSPMTVIDYLNSQPDLPTTPILSTAKRTAESLGIASRNEDGQLIANNPTIKQMEKWRQEINGNVNAEAPNIRQATILKQFIDSHVEPSAGTLYKAARIERKRFADKWENHSIIKNLTTNKTGTEDRRVAIENIVDNVINKSSLDDLRIAKRTIMTSGEEGRQAWKEIQGEVLRDIKNAATAGVAPDAQGQQMISPAQLNKAIKKLDDAGKLDFIFGQNGAEKLRALNDVSKAIFTVPASAAVNHSNTAANLIVAMDLVMSGMSGFPAPVASALRIATKHIKDNKTRARVQQALNPRSTTNE